MVFILTDEQRLYMLSYSFISYQCLCTTMTMFWHNMLLQSQDCLVLVRALLAHFQTSQHLSKSEPLPLVMLYTYMTQHSFHQLLHFLTVSAAGNYSNSLLLVDVPRFLEYHPITDTTIQSLRVYGFRPESVSSQTATSLKMTTAE